MPQAIARDYETLDQICLRTLGTTRGTVEAALNLNPGLAAKGVHLAAGDAVQLPDAPTTTTRPTINLWD